MRACYNEDMKQRWLFFVGFIALAPVVALAQAPVLHRNLGIGARGGDVVLLQQMLNRDPETMIATSGLGSPGQETEYFGALTRAAVAKFQHKYRSEVLYTVGLLGPTGYVGAMTRAKLISLATVRAPIVTQSPPPAVTPPSVPSTPATAGRPVILSVSPNKVRRGEVVTITGENFSTVGNTVILADGLVGKNFDNLPSPDGKTITFVYQPPNLPVTTEADIRALPPDIVALFEKPIVAAGSTLSKEFPPYQDIHSEAEVREFLERNGHSFDEMYYKFWTIVKNTNGEGMSDAVLLSGLRAFPFDAVATDSSLLSRLGERLSQLATFFLPLASAADFGGGINSGRIMNCNCSSGYLTFQLSWGGRGLGTFLYYYSNGFRPTVGSSQSVNNWLGFFDTMGAPASCWIRAGWWCFPIPANAPKTPIGYSLFP